MTPCGLLRNMTARSFNVEIAVLKIVLFTLKYKKFITNASKRLFYSNVVRPK